MQESYFNYIKRRYQEMSEKYQHQGDLFRFGYTQCCECGDLLHQSEVERVIYYKGGKQVTEDFCPDKFKVEDSCRIKWYLKEQKKLDTMRTLGL